MADRPVPQWVLDSQARDKAAKAKASKSAKKPKGAGADKPSSDA